MLTREKIDEQVTKLVEKNRFEKSFIPIIEEFFFRVSDQCEWKEYELNNAIDRFERVCSIKFMNFWERKYLIFKTSKYSNGCMTQDYSNGELCIFFDVDDLKSILSFKKNQIQNFINNAMHELGHVIQTLAKQDNKWNTGFRINILDTKTKKKLKSIDVMINELAEVINAERLQNGNLENNEYGGYFEIQNAGEIILSSLGITKLKLANLQFEANAREAYEKYISAKLGEEKSKKYRDGFGEILDAIYNFSTDERQRDNLLLQIDALQILSNKVFEERFENVMNNSSNILEDLAKISIDESRKNIALMELFDQFNIINTELQIIDYPDINTKVSEKGYDDEYLKKLSEVELEVRLKIQEQTEKENEKQYNNEELIEKLYQSFLKYPISEVPFKDRIGVIKSKVMGKIRRMVLNKKLVLLPEENESKNDEHTEFVSRMSDLEEFKGETNFVLKANKVFKVTEERNKENEDIR